MLLPSCSPTASHRSTLAPPSFRPGTPSLLGFRALFSKSFAPQPQPVPEPTNPRGKPGLSEQDQIKVDKANAIYDFCAAVACYCLDRDIGFTIENPMKSYLWMLPEYQLLQLRKGVHKVSF